MGWYLKDIRKIVDSETRALGKGFMKRGYKAE
jgi:hypothetical protein